MLFPISILLAAAAAVDPAVLWSQAKAFLDHQQYAEARKVLSQAVKAAPREGAFWYHLGVSCAELKDTDCAIHSFETARKLSPQVAEIYFSLGLQYWHGGDLAKARESYQAGLKLSPGEPRGLQNLALLAMKTGDYASAIEPLLSLKKVPDLTLPARVSLIECYSKLRNVSNAARETDELLSSGLASPEDETKLGVILLQLGDAAGAERVLRASLARRPDQSKACAALGVIVLNQEKYQEAAALLTEAMKLEPDSAEYAMAFAETLLLGRRQNELLAFLKQVEPKFGQLPEFQYKLALAYYGSTRLSETVAALEKLLAMNPRRKDQIYYLLGNSYQAMGKLADAEKNYRSAIQMNPKDPAYSEQHATVLRTEGPERLDEAISELIRSLQANPSNPSLLLQLALCYESKGDLKSALAPAEEAVLRKPEVLPAHVALARIYFKLGKRAEGKREKTAIAELEEKQQQAREATRSPAGSMNAQVP